MAVLITGQTARAVACLWIVVALSICGARTTFAQSTSPSTAPDLVITATRTALEPARAGSSITVLGADDIAKTGATGVVDVLRQVPGLDIVQTGGLGASTSVSLRGAADGQTLVLIDGINIGDPTSTAGQTDLGQLSAQNIERIEVLRGPQSALYGSNAMGGVINIITKSGTQGPKRDVSVEAGSYGTLHTRGTMSGGSETATYAVSIDALHADGFARFGDHINRPIVLNAYGTPFVLPPVPGTDPVTKGGITARMSNTVNPDLRIDAGLNANGDWLRLSNPGVTRPAYVYDPYNTASETRISGFTRATLDAWDGRLRNQVTLFGTYNNSQTRERQICSDASYNAFDCTLGYIGTRYGAEYQGDLKLGSYGLLTFGVRNQTETAATSQTPNPNDGSFSPINAQQSTNSIFAQHQFTIWDRLDLSLGGRVDQVTGGNTFATYRAAAAYRVTETGTRFHTSVGTGARNPSLYERFSAYGTTGLQPERNDGVDIGVDQSLLDNRVRMGVTGFMTHYSNLIEFGTSSACSTSQNTNLYGCYYNVGRALTQGIELTGDVILVPDMWKARANYTYLIAKKVDPDMSLLRRARNKVNTALVYTGIPKLEIEARATFVGSRKDVNYYDGTGTNPIVQLSPYMKFDTYVTYKVNDTVSVFARGENLTNRRYEEVLDYSVSGRALYAGVKVTW